MDGAKRRVWVSIRTGMGVLSLIFVIGFSAAWVRSYFASDDFVWMKEWIYGVGDHVDFVELLPASGRIAFTWYESDASREASEVNDGGSMEASRAWARWRETYRRGGVDRYRLDAIGKNSVLGKAVYWAGFAWASTPDASGRNRSVVVPFWFLVAGALAPAVLAWRSLRKDRRRAQGTGAGSAGDG